MGVTIINNDMLKDLNNGKAINIELGPFGITLASEKWVERMENMGNIIKEEDKND